MSGSEVCGCVGVCVCGGGGVLKLGFELGTPILAQTDLEKSGNFSHAKSMQMLYLFQPI